MNVESVALDLWSRDIKCTNDLWEGGRNKIISVLGEDSLNDVDKMLTENWNKWTQNMYEFFNKP